MARILRGDVRWADLGGSTGREQAGHRPVVVLSHDVFNAHSGTVIALPLTRQQPRAGYPLTLECNARGLPKQSWYEISQVRTMSTARLGRRLGRATDEELQRAIDGLNEIISEPT